MTTKEKIKVMQAFVDGKAIQIKSVCGANDWTDQNGEPLWDWYGSIYRIKSETKIRPYTFKEMKEAVKKHGSWVWQGNDSAFSISFIDNEGVVFNYSDPRPYKELLDEFCWFDDDSPCGVVEE